MSFDYRTLMFFLGILAFILGLLSIGYTIITKSKKNCLKYFFAGKFLEGFGTIGIALRGQIPDFVSLQVSNIILILGIAFEIYAITIYNTNIKKRLIYAFAYIAFIASILYISFIDFYIIRSTITAAAGGLITLIGGFNLLKTRGEYKFPILISFSLFFYTITRCIQPLQLLNLPIDYNPGNAVVDSLTLLLSSASIVHGIGFFLLLNEVGERIVKNKNAELEELNKAKDKLFSIIAHDLKFPLATFNYMLDSAEVHMDKGEPGKLKQLLKLIKNNSKNIYDFLDNLLHWSKSQLNRITLKSEEFDMSELILDTINVFEATLINKNITITNNFDKPYLIIADYEMIKVVVRNLLSNAIKFSPKNGSINIRLSQESDKLVLAIKDNGIGIESEKMQNIFSFTGNQHRKGTEGEPGTGLGLALSKEFVNKNKGEIWAESELGKGCTFYVQLPVNFSTQKNKDEKLLIEG